jgi:phosphoribosylglycinamide formyltransferase-1
VKKTAGNNRKDLLRLGILGSTRGTDMLAIIESIEGQRLQAEIAVVISDKKRAGILEKATEHCIPAVHIPVKTDEGKRLSREEFDQTIDRQLKYFKVDFVLLIGYMRIVSAWFCRQWEGRLINVHPSLLPDFAGGMDGDVHKAVIAAGKKETGCTVHQVTANIDAGPILLQKRCPVYPEDTPDKLKQRVQFLEGEALIEVIERFIQAQ